MIELVAAIFESIFNAILAVFGYATESLTRSAHSHAGRPDTSPRQFPLTGVLVSLALPLVVLGLLAGWYWQGKAAKRRMTDTQILVEQQAARLEAQLSPDDYFDRHPGPLLEATDSWYNPLRIVYEDNLVHEKLTVSSDGPDQEPGTEDDISDSRRRLLPKREMAGNLFEKAVDKAKEKLLGDGQE